MALTDVIGRLAEVNEEQLLETQNIKIEIESLSDRFASFIRIAEGDKLDKLEERREERKKSRGMGFTGRAKEAAQQAKQTGLTLIDLLVKGAGLAVAAGVIIPLLMQNEEVKKAMGDLGSALGDSVSIALERVAPAIGTAIASSLQVTLDAFLGNLGRELRVEQAGTETKERIRSEVLDDPDLDMQKMAQMVLGKGEYADLVPNPNPTTAKELKQNKDFIMDILSETEEGKAFVDSVGIGAAYRPTSEREQAARMLRSSSSGIMSRLGQGIGSIYSAERIAEEGQRVRLLAPIDDLAAVYNQVEEIIDTQAEKPVGMSADTADIPYRPFEEFTQQYQGIIPEIPKGTIRGDVEPAPIPGIGLLRGFFSDGGEQEEVSAPLRVLTPEERISLSSMGGSPTTNAGQIKGYSTAVGVGSAPAPAIVPVPIPTPSAGAGGGGGPVPGKHGISYMSGESKFTPFFRMSAISGSLDLLGTN